MFWLGECAGKHYYEDVYFFLLKMDLASVVSVQPTAKVKFFFPLE